MNLDSDPQRRQSPLAGSSSPGRPSDVSAEQKDRDRQPRAKKISRTTVNFFLDGALLVTFLTLLWTATVLHFVFPPGPDASGWTLWGLNFVQWSDVHFGVLCVLALGILVHVMLHWTWVCGVAAKALSRGKKGRPPMDDGTRTLYGVATLIVLLHVVGIGIAAAWLSIHPPILN